MLRTQTPYKSRGSALRHVASRPDAARPSLQSRGAGHKTNLLTLLSAGTARTGELAAVLEMSSPYVGLLLGDLELEGRVEKVGRGVWRAA